MRKYLPVSFTLVVVVTILTLFMKYPPFEEKQDIAIKNGMTLRHIAERNDVPIEACPNDVLGFASISKSVVKSGA